VIILKRGAGTAVHEADKKRQVFAPHEREHYKKAYEGQKHVLSGGEVPAAMGGGSYKAIDRVQDVAQLHRNMRQNKSHYERGQPINLTPGIRNELWRKLKVLKDQVTVGMVSKLDLHPVKIKKIIKNGVAVMDTVVDNTKITHSRAIERNKAWYQKNSKNLMEVKRILRILEPNDPNITKVVDAKWRPET